MPSKPPAPDRLTPLIAVRGNAAYARYLDRLLKAVRGTGATITSRHQLAEYALTVLGLKFEMMSPPRAKPHGTNRFGVPKH